MTPRFLITTLTTLTVAATAMAQPTVTMNLGSSRDGQTVSPGTLIDWTITIDVSIGDNEGLALVTCDLAQALSNPELFDLPPADFSSIDATMQNFNRPDGVCNPGEAGEPTGYIGVRRGVAGQRNLVQIGGAQNVFGEALPPGTGIAETANIIAGVGQIAAQVVAAGSFTAPAAGGEYVFQIENAIANVLDQVNPPPDFSPVSQAMVVLAASSFSIIVVNGVDCPEDLAAPVGVEQQDLNAVLNRWGDPACEDGGAAFPCPEDLAVPPGVEQQDLNAVLNRWGDPDCEPADGRGGGSNGRGRKIR